MYNIKISKSINAVEPRFKCKRRGFALYSYLERNLSNTF